MSEFLSANMAETTQNVPGKSKAELNSLPLSVLESTTDDQYEVILDASESPKNMATAHKWTIASVTETGVVEDLHTVEEVSILGDSLFVEGLGLGPLLVGPLSEVYGRNPIYRFSYFFFWVFTWPVAFPPNIATYLVFRFLSGFLSSAFLSVAGGSVGDLFVNEKVATPMAVYTLSPFIGPVLDPIAAGFICQNTNRRWAYRVLLIWQFVTFMLLIVLVPETYEPVLRKTKAARVHKETGDEKYWAPLDRRERSLFQSILFNCYTPFKLILLDRMALLLDLCDGLMPCYQTALLLGILYLAFQAFPIIFGNVHGFNLEDSGLAFIGIGVGFVFALASQPLWNRFNRRMMIKYEGKPPPETRLVVGQVGGILAPIGLFWLAFTTYKGVPWIVPIIASIPFGAGMYFIFTSVFTYLVIAYRPIAASAMTSNAALRCSFAAAFPLFANAMYDRLGTVGSTALLGDLTTLMAPLPFIYHKIGATLRAKSPFAAKPGKGLSSR
ncbi:MFS general substrate transporter [Wolfiporia cocos MD-104 SS10]|uniref:MFS general substrate transporter n=1 Tax=Wolfiporia cocos (strain MD-104) TaxID=742152 RepID=A0A2H3JQA7_WOLCO|nr:MFS general substrate transporter [Wolfiporia cocos MD-104 SS10]